MFFKQNLFLIMMRKSSNNQRINWLVVTVLIFLPIFVAIGVGIYCMEYGCGWKRNDFSISSILYG